MNRPSDMQPAPSPSRKLTYEDYLGFPDDGRRHELIDGIHVVTPSPTRRHQQLSVRLTFLIQSHLDEHPVGELYHAPFDVILSDADVVEPDLLFVSRERASILGEWVRGAPDLVVEILSPGTRRTDEVTKRGLYERAGVREYWVVDPDRETVKVFRRLSHESPPSVAELRRAAGESLATPLLPGLEISLDALFR